VYQDDVVTEKVQVIHHPAKVAVSAYQNNGIWGWMVGGEPPNFHDDSDIRGALLAARAIDHRDSRALQFRPLRLVLSIKIGDGDKVPGQ